MSQSEQNNTVENSGINGHNTHTGTTVQNDLPSLAMIQNWMPNFDGVSAVTPDYFIDTVEQLMEKLLISDSQKLLIIKSKIKGEALTNFINNSELSKETNFSTFKTKFLEYFGRNQSLALRHQNLAACRQKPEEDIKNFAARLTRATRDFFGDTKFETPEMQTVYNQTRLARLLESVLPQYRPQLLTKDVQSFDEAIKFIQLLQANQLILDTPGINSMTSYTVGPPHNNTDQLKADVTNLAKEIANLHIQNNRIIEKLENINGQQVNDQFMRGHRCRYCARFNCTIPSHSNNSHNPIPREPQNYTQERTSRSRFSPPNRPANRYPNFFRRENSNPRYGGSRDRRWTRSTERRWSDGRREQSGDRQNNRWEYGPRGNYNQSFGGQRGMPRYNREGNRPRRSLN